MSQATRVVGASRSANQGGAGNRLILLALLGLGLWGLSALRGPAPAAAAEEGEREFGFRGWDVETVLSSAAAAIERGSYEDADHLLRRAVTRAPRDGRGSEMLRALHARRDFKLPVEEESVREVLSQLGPGYRVTETRHFVIVSDCGASWRRRREALLERTYHEVMRFSGQIGVSVYPPATKLLCVMMHDHEAYEAFGRAQDDVRAHWVAGYYAGESNRIVLYNDETGPNVRELESRLTAIEEEARAARAQARSSEGDRARAYEERAQSMERFVRVEREKVALGASLRSEAKTIHEAAHLIAFNCGLQVRSRRYPMWITEGLATGFETSDPERSFGPDRECGEREEQFGRMLREGRIVGLRGFIGQLRASEKAEIAEAEYALAYALFRYLSRYHREELGALLGDIAMEPPGEISPGRHVELFEGRLGSVERVERRWLRLEGRRGR